MVQNRQFVWDHIYSSIDIFIKNFKMINNLKMCYL